ncbi:MAG TPA: haloacid dehalogenase-like hydrolase, partial [Bdellovibrionota bacterium]|nr:haloacid dehalogenase-like hydrolase [Bdellovibrionota bacterium]
SIMKRTLFVLSLLICTILVGWAIAAMSDWTVGNRIRIQQLIKNQKPLVIVILEGGLLDSDDRGAGYLEYMLKRGPLKGFNAKSVMQKYKELSEYDEVEAQKYMASLFDGMPESKIANASAKYFHKKLSSRIFPKIQDLISTFQSNGFDVYIASSQPYYLAIAAAEAVDVDPKHVIGVQNVVIGGKLTKNLLEPVPVASGASIVVKKITDRQPIVVIGSSEKDRYLLSMAEQLTIVINPDSPTRQVASSSGWITQFFGR